MVAGLRRAAPAAGAVRPPGGPGRHQRGAGPRAPPGRREPRDHRAVRRPRGLHRVHREPLARGGGGRAQPLLRCRDPRWCTTRAVGSTPSRATPPCASSARPTTSPTTPRRALRVALALPRRSPPARRPASRGRPAARRDRRGHGVGGGGQHRHARALRVHGHRRRRERGRPPHRAGQAAVPRGAGRRGDAAGVAGPTTPGGLARGGHRRAARPLAPHPPVRAHALDDDEPPDGLACDRSATRRRVRARSVLVERRPAGVALRASSASSPPRPALVARAVA